MSNFRTIEIDIDVHKHIEGKREDFSEIPNDILRRILGLQKRKDSQITNTSEDNSNRSWSGSCGVTLPHNTLLKMTYNGTTYQGKVDNGKWIVEGKEFSSPSGAAIGVAKTKEGRTTFLNGKRLWYVKKPDATEWVLFDRLEGDKKKP